MENNELIRLLNKDFAFGITGQLSYDEIHAQLSAYINELINKDFDRLVSYLYRIDVPEQKLKTLLQQHRQDDAGNIIAGLVIERQEQKIRSRELFSKRDNDIDEEEKW